MSPFAPFAPTEDFLPFVASVGTAMIDARAPRPCRSLPCLALWLSTSDLPFQTLSLCFRQLSCGAARLVGCVRARNVGRVFASVRDLVHSLG